MPTSLFIVRATIADPTKRAAFDDWYRKDHLPWAVKAFGAQKARRCWSDTDPAQHIATYQFSDRVALDRGTAPEIMKPLVEDFDRVWPGIGRTREVMTVVEEIDAS
jgi:hypothetical protein